jgi:hypothetical protein
MKISQQQQATSLLAAMQALDERAAELEHVDRAALNWQPPEGGWSAGQVLEHLCVANDSYLVELRDLLSRSAPAGTWKSGDVAWRPSFAGRLLVSSMESPRKLPAPKIWRPVPAPRPDVIAEFLARQREIAALIERSMGTEWRRVRMASPVSRFIRMNIGDAFTVLVRHAERHFRQIDARLASYDAAARPPVTVGRRPVMSARDR